MVRAAAIAAASVTRKKSSDSSRSVLRSSPICFSWLRNKAKMLFHTSRASYNFVTFDPSLLPGRKRLAGWLFFLQSERPVSLHEGVNITRALVDDRGFAVTQ